MGGKWKSGRRGGDGKGRAVETVCVLHVFPFATSFDTWLAFSALCCENCFSSVCLALSSFFHPVSGDRNRIKEQPGVSKDIRMQKMWPSANKNHRKRPRWDGNCSCGKSAVATKVKTGPYT